MASLIRACLFLLALLPALVLADGRPRASAAEAGKLLPSPDALLARSLQEIRASRLDAALREIDQLIALRPDFKLAHLIKGDLLLARAKPLASLGGGRAAPEDSLADFRDEARVRLLRYIDQPDPDLMPKQVLQLAPEQRYALLADAQRARLYLFENVNGEPRLLHDYYLTVGRNGIEKRSEGDKRTPVGVYTISGRIPGSQLSDFYGPGAFPLSYPNEWDQAQGRSGHGIWLHGVPSGTYSRPPRASDGCLVVSNPDWQEIAQYIQTGTTPVVIVERAEWLERTAWEAQRQALLDTLAGWTRDWENRDADAFLGRYSPDFLRREGKGWTESKRRNIVGKDWIKVSLTDLSLFHYPDEDMAVVTFDQDYRSDSFNSSGRKRLYLRQEKSGQWRIALEKNLPAGNRLASR